MVKKYNDSNKVSSCLNRSGFELRFRMEAYLKHMSSNVIYRCFYPDAIKEQQHHIPSSIR